MSFLYAYKPAKDRILCPFCRALMRAGVTPNMVTAAGLSLSVAAGLLGAYGELHWAIIVFLAGASLDALDGSLARACGMGSEFGRYFDSFADRASELFFVVGAVLGGVPATAFLVVLGSFALLGARLYNHRRGLSSNAAMFGRPERLSLLVAGLLCPAPFDTAFFAAALALCLVSSVQALASGSKWKLMHKNRSI
jgi:phosphatidylglycerophosphate synthase